MEGWIPGGRGGGRGVHVSAILASWCVQNARLLHRHSGVVLRFIDVKTPSSRLPISGYNKLMLILFCSQS